MTHCIPNVALLVNANHENTPTMRLIAGDGRAGRCGPKRIAAFSHSDHLAAPIRPSISTSWDHNIAIFSTSPSAAVPSANPAIAISSHQRPLLR
jgi:hypothetical protein